MIYEGRIQLITPRDFTFLFSHLCCHGFQQLKRVLRRFSIGSAIVLITCFPSKILNEKYKPVFLVLHEIVISEIFEPRINYQNNQNSVQKNIHVSMCYHFLRHHSFCCSQYNYILFDISRKRYMQRLTLQTVSMYAN